MGADTDAMFALLLSSETVFDPKTLAELPCQGCSHALLGTKLLRRTCLALKWKHRLGLVYC